MIITDQPPLACTDRNFLGASPPKGFREGALIRIVLPQHRA